MENLKVTRKIVFMGILVSIIGLAFFSFLIPPTYFKMGVLSNGKLIGKVNPIIYITSNANLYTYASQGNGSASNPYIIENKVINGWGSSSCIFIKDTTAFFILQGCEVFNGTYGIQLDNVTNGELRNNIVHHNIYNGFYLYLTQCTLLDNFINNNQGTGIRLTSLENCTLLNNTIHNNGGSGIYLKTSMNCNLTINIVHSNIEMGIILESSNNSLLSGNTVSNNSDYGIYSSSSNNCNLTTNIISNNTIGIFLDKSANCLLSNNTVHDNDNDGFFVTYSNNCRFCNNLISNHSRDGFYIWYSDNCICCNNTLDNNSVYGISLGYSNNCNLTGNQISHTKDAGVDVISSDNTSIYNNTINFNNKGVFIGLTNYTIITDNIINWNDYGIYLSSQVHHANITWNILYNNIKCIYVSPDGINNIIENNDCQDKSSPISGFTWVFSIVGAILAIALLLILKQRHPLAKTTKSFRLKGKY